MIKENKSNVIRLTDLEKNLVKKLRVIQGEPIYIPNPLKKSEQPIFYVKGKKRVLVVGDLHCPFDLLKYLDHCKMLYKMYSCNEVVFIGDVIDQHFSSYHEVDPDGFGGGEELERAKFRLGSWYKAFPNATVIIGNHDRLIRRKAFSGGIPKAWIKEFSDVLNVPKWVFAEYTIIDGVLYEHGEGGTARTRIKNEHQSIVQGHLHTQAYIEWIFNAKQRIFGMQVGTGIDFDSYSFTYAKRGKKPAVSAGVILNGTTPFLHPMEL